MAIERSTKAQNYLKSLTSKYPSSKALKECSTNCYDSCVGDFKSALKELVEDPLSASYDAFVAGDEPSRCDKLLADEKKVNDPSISASNDEMKFLSRIGNLAITYIQKGDM
ncbi:plant invertase/pectin methylesterase inhibitor protein [Trifolium pratense]|uniref:Plant invertase/pectin methylesterase inhibitor protein n=2 Tax=Trifolium pratense TaxID=57577 RepID=A0A2K3LMV1_TRIPR|nr:uncharacterized protein LOC123904669 [Trifolium pratense]PNX79862.1 plant invertase/pectin methylesterase inhibitor protein [Trifolium pratense]CAJ2650050.1 unnamed protein product [Trifolium pratense]